VLTHIVLWTFSETVPDAEREGILAALRALPAAIPAIRSLQVGENRSPARAHGYTHVLVETFDDRDGLAAYGSHPAHLPVLDRMRAATAQLLAVDLEAAAG